MKIKLIAQLALILIIFFWSQLTHGQSIIINEFLASNQNVIADQDSAFSDWIEFYNSGEDTIDLADFSLSDDPTNSTKWIFPTILIKPKKFLLVWASGKDRTDSTALHTNFKLNAGGEFIGLYNSIGKAVDSLSFGPQTSNVSFGRSPDGSLSWQFFKSPTPGGSNNEAEVLVPAPVFSQEQGLLDSPINLELIDPGSDLKIYYTMNGDIPIQSSMRYTSPIPITETTVIRARCYNAKNQPGLTVTKSYLIHENAYLPVLSLIMAPADLWDETTGIYANPYNHGIDWERPVSITLFTKENGVEFSSNAGIRIHGESSRASEKKSFRIYFRSEYGRSKLNYRLFETRAADEYKRFLVRSGGQDNPLSAATWCLLRAPMFHTLHREVQPTFSSAKPTILFINGKLWGIYFFRERIDEHYVQNNFGINDPDLIKSTPWHYGGEVIVGDKEHWKETFIFFRRNYMGDPENYEQAKELIDLENFTDHNIFNIYGANWDWPHGNVFKFRPRTPAGKWRWVIWDVDGIFGRDVRARYPSWNGLEWATRDKVRLDLNTSDAENLLWSTEMLRSLLNSQDYRHYFLNRFADLLNTTLKCSHVHHILDSLAVVIEPDVHLETSRWAGTVEMWREHVAYMKDYASKREHYVYQHLLEKFAICDTITVTISSNLPEGGSVKINTITVAQFPWKGAYFLGVPITLKAQPNQGYRFTGWKGSLAQQSSDSLAVVPEGSLDIQPQFSKINFWTPRIVINEFLAANQSSFTDEYGEFDDWIELYNDEENSILLQGKYLSNDFVNPTQWPFPDTTIEAKGYLLIWADGDTSQGKLHTNFKLDKAGEQIGLFESDAKINIPIDTVTFTGQKDDTSFGRIKDGDSLWTFFNIPTPGAKNVFNPDTTSLRIHHISVDKIICHRAQINWLTTKPATSVVKFGLHADSLAQLVQDANLVLQHQFYLNQLTPATTYYFQIHAETAKEMKQEADTLHFATLTQGDSLDIKYEVEVMPIRTAGQYEKPGWNFGSNGVVGQFFNLPQPGLCKYSFRARGKAAYNVWPIFELIVDDSILTIDTVNVVEYDTFCVSSHLDSGLHFINICFTNYYSDSLVTRALVGDWLHIKSVNFITGTENLLGSRNLPEPVKLEHNFPNPANSGTQIQYSIPHSTEVTLKIYNLAGQEVRTLINSFQPAGRYSVTWNGRNQAEQPVASGIYLYQLRANGVVRNRKILLLK